MAGFNVWEWLGIPWGTNLVIATALFAIVYTLLVHWAQGGRCTSKARMDGKVVLITGANTGIGLETAKELAARGAEVHLLCRDMAKANLAATKVGFNTRVWSLDLSSLESVRNCADQIKSELDRVDVLVNNAGIMACPLSRTVEGFEMQLGTNHIGPFLLTQELLPLLRKSEYGRIVTVSSRAHKPGKIFFEDLNFNTIAYTPFKAYNQSKLANILFTKELARREREAGSNVTANCLHPGVVKTELSRFKGESKSATLFHYIFMVFLAPFCKDPLAGAQTSIFCCVDESLQGVSGFYFADCQKTPTAPLAEDMDVAAKLWQETVKMIEKKQL